MSLKHTKSPSGKTHRLTHTSAHPSPIVTSVTLRYRERPQFDDQVQGDLLRKMQAEHNLAWGVGMLGVHIDPDLLDRGQKPHSLEYLRGYLAGLEAGEPTSKLVQEIREQIAKLEAQRTGVSISEIAYGGPVVNIQGPPPAAGAGRMQVNQIDQVQRPRVSRLDEGVRRVRDAERNG